MGGVKLSDGTVELYQDFYFIQWGYIWKTSYTGLKAFGNYLIDLTSVNTSEQVTSFAVTDEDLKKIGFKDIRSANIYLKLGRN
jgi:hypothetical protein